MSKTNEVESPILHITYGDYCDCNYQPWACADGLAELFETENVKRLCFVAKPRGDRSSYKIKLGPHGTLDPAVRYLYTGLLDWLKKQIAAGRPHIGVRIVK